MRSGNIRLLEDDGEVLTAALFSIDSSPAAAPCEFELIGDEDEFVVAYPYQGNNLRITHCRYASATTTLPGSGFAELCICPYGRDMTVDVRDSSTALVIKWDPATGA